MPAASMNAAASPGSQRGPAVRLVGVRADKSFALMQIALGAVYAWSVFRIPLTRDYGWTISEVTVAFELAILVLGFAAFLGGLWMKRSGPRPVALLAAVLYGLGTVLAGLSHSLPMLYLTYGVIGEMG